MLKDFKEFFLKRAPLGAVGGLWAMIPDLEFFFEDLNIHSQSYVNIFFFHGTFDKVLPENDLFIAAEFLLIFMVVNIFSMAMTVESFATLKIAIFGEKEEEEEEEKIKAGKRDESEIGKEKEVDKHEKNSPERNSKG